MIRSLGERDAVVVGQGLGGLVAWTLSVVHPRQVRRLVAVSMPHPRRLRRAHLTDVRARSGPAGTCSATRRRWCRSAGWSPTTPRRSRPCCRQWSGPGFPDAETEARYRQAAQIPGVAHCALESYRWAVRSIPRPDGVRYARRMASPVTVPTLQVHGALDRCVLPGSAQGSGTLRRGALPLAPDARAWGTSRTRRTRRRSRPCCATGWTTRAPEHDELTTTGRDRDRGRPGPQHPAPRRARPPAAARRRGRRAGARRPGAAAARSRWPRRSGCSTPAGRSTRTRCSRAPGRPRPTAERDLWQGLAQLAVGLTHRARGNPAGAATLLRRGAARIAPYAGAPPYGIDVDGLVATARALAAEPIVDGEPPRTVRLRT